MPGSFAPAIVLLIGPAGALSGGDVHALRLIEAWNRRSPGAVLVIGPSELESFLSKGSDVRQIVLRTPFDRSMRGNPSALSAGLAWRALSSIPKVRGSSTVVASSHLIFDVFPAAVAHRLWKTPVVSFAYHLIAESERPPSLRSSLAVAVERFSLSLLHISSATVFVDNVETMAALDRRGFPKEHVWLSSNAYDPIEPLVEPCPQDPPRIAFVGRLVESKGLWDLVDLAEELASRGSPMKIDLIGDGPLRAPLMERLKERVSRTCGCMDLWRSVGSGRSSVRPRCSWPPAMKKDGASRLASHCWLAFL